MRFAKGGYRVIDVPVGLGGVLHTLYIKEHNNPKSTDLTSNGGDDNQNLKGRVLFVSNVDYGLKRTHTDIDGYLREIFQGFGEIISVSVSKFKRRVQEVSENEEIDNNLDSEYIDTSHEEDDEEGENN